MWNLDEVIKYLKEHNDRKENIYMTVRNINKNRFGDAVIINDNQIKVYEGREDGSEDIIYSKKEFNKNYEITALVEETFDYKKIISKDELKRPIYKNTETEKSSLENIKRKINQILKEKNYEDFELQYILKNRDEYENTIAVVIKDNEILEINPFKKEINNIPNWMYSYDTDFFQELEWNKEIIYMNEDAHYDAWDFIAEFYPEDIYYKDGVQLYLQYCADNNITKEYLEKKLSFDLPNIMDNFKGLALYETMTYNGYIIEADETNIEDHLENIVNIYNSKKDYKERNCIEIVSLNTIGLKENIKEYIDEFYVDKTLKNVKKQKTNKSHER